MVRIGLQADCTKMQISKTFGNSLILRHCCAFTVLPNQLPANSAGPLRLQCCCIAACNWESKAVTAICNDATYMLYSNVAISVARITNYSTKPDSARHPSAASQGQCCTQFGVCQADDSKYCSEVPTCQADLSSATSTRCRELVAKLPRRVRRYTLVATEGVRAPDGFTRTVRSENRTAKRDVIYHDNNRAWRAVGHAGHALNGYHGRER